MNVGLFVPCYVDQLAPAVGWATLRVLERAGCRVHYVQGQTCCGQPFLNTGANRQARRLAKLHLSRFAACDTVVCPSASCVATVRHRYAELGAGRDARGSEQRRRTFELSEFLVRELGAPDLAARFPHRVALLQSCHGLRELGLGTPSERVGPVLASPAESLLGRVAGLELVKPARRDECCGFGGSFSVKFPELSVRMGRARLAEFAAAGAEYVTGTDVSCLIHLDAIRRRTGEGPQAIHLAELLAGAEDA